MCAGKAVRWEDPGLDTSIHPFVFCFLQLTFLSVVKTKKLLGGPGEAVKGAETRQDEPTSTWKDVIKEGMKPDGSL